MTPPSEWSTAELKHFLTTWSEIDSRFDEAGSSCHVSHLRRVEPEGQRDAAK